MSDYKKTKEEFIANSKSTVASKSGLQALNNAYFNDLDYESKRLAIGDDGVTEVGSHPARDFRDGMKKVIGKTFGVDSGEVGKLDDVELPRSVTDPMLEGVSFVQKDYLDSGRGLSIPTTHKDEAVMKISLKEVGEKTIDTKKIVKKDDGTYESVPTGERVTHKARKVISPSNKVPEHLTVKTKI